MTNRYVLFIPVAVLGCTDAAMPELGEADALDEVGELDAPVIKSVRTDDGFHQIRQDALSHLVIRGGHLDTATSVTVGPLTAQIDSAAPHEIRASVVAPPGLLGRFDVTVVTSAGTATRPEALRVTPWVVSPGAVGGHGTFESPMSLCDLEFEPPGPGDTVQLLAGTYSCDGFVELNSGIVVEGAGRDRTFLQGAFVFSVAFGQGGPATTTIRDLALLAPVLPEVLAGHVVVERVTATTRFFVGNRASATFDHYAFEGPGTGVIVDNASVALDHFRYVGPGTALSVTNGEAEIANSTIRNCGDADGIAIGGSDGSRVTLDSVIVDGCARGVFLTGPRFPFSHLTGMVTIAHSNFIDNRVAVFLEDGSAMVQDTVIRDDETTPQVPQFGIITTNGDVDVVGGRISGQSVAGIAVSLSSIFDPGGDLTVTGAVIEGGPVGIDFSGTDELSSVHLRSSKIRGQTVAAILVSSGASTIDLSSASTPDDPNILSTVSGFAIDDRRSFVDPLHRYIDATGTRLNGVVFPTQILDGPVAVAPYFRITGGDSGIRF